MTEIVDAVAASLRRPEYTGENRCPPCTAVNVLIAVVLAGVLLAVSFPLAAVTLAVSLAAIYFRGYLVPRTPALTERYFPERVLRWFDKSAEPAPPDAAPNGGAEPVDTETLLFDAGAVVECERGEDLCLDDAFRADWRERVAELRADDTTREDLARVLGVDPDTLVVEDYGSAFVAGFDGGRLGQWESRAAFVADIAAANELRERYPAWADVPIRDRSRTLRGLRIFLDRCPDCDGPVTMARDTVDSCCRSVDVVAASCDACNARLFESEPMPA